MAEETRPRRSRSQEDGAFLVNAARTVGMTLGQLTRVAEQTGWAGTKPAPSGKRQPRKHHSKSTRAAASARKTAAGSRFKAKKRGGATITSRARAR